MQDEKLPSACLVDAILKVSISRDLWNDISDDELERLTTAITESIENLNIITMLEAELLSLGIGSNSGLEYSLEL